MRKKNIKINVSNGQILDSLHYSFYFWCISIFVISCGLFFGMIALMLIGIMMSIVSSNVLTAYEVGYHCKTKGYCKLYSMGLINSIVMVFIIFWFIVIYLL